MKTEYMEALLLFSGLYSTRAITAEFCETLGGFLVFYFPPLLVYLLVIISHILFYKGSCSINLFLGKLFVDFTQKIGDIDQCEMR